MCSSATFDAVEKCSLLLFAGVAFATNQTRNFHYPITIADITIRTWTDEESGFVVMQGYMRDCAAGIVIGLTHILMQVLVGRGECVLRNTLEKIPRDRAHTLIVEVKRGDKETVWKEGKEEESYM
jgi:hypothetical protein